MKTSHLFNYLYVKFYILGRRGVEGLGSNHSPACIANCCEDESDRTWLICTFSSFLHTSDLLMYMPCICVSSSSVTINQH